MNGFLSPMWVFLAVVVYGVVHSLLASLSAKAFARHRMGALADRWYRLAYNLFAVLSFLPVLALPALLPDRAIYAVPLPWALLMLAIQAGAALVLIVGVLQTGLWSFLGLRQLVENGRNQESNQLVVSGLYRWVRHPLYTAGLIFIWFLPRMTANLLALNLGLSLYLVLGAWVEERKLLAEFGEAYADYRRQTPMLVPLPRKR